MDAHACGVHRLFTELVESPTMLASATLGREWLTQMDTAAQTAGLVIQYVPQSGSSYFGL